MQMGSKMMTIGGLLLNSNDLEIFESLSFDEYKFVKEGEESFDIVVPSLTLKEIRFLNGLLPDGVDSDGRILDEALCALSNPNIPSSDIKKYSKIYSFFPLYTEAFSM